MLDEFIEEEKFNQENPIEQNSLVKIIENYIDDEIAGELNFNDENMPLIEDRNQAEYFVGLYKKSQQKIEENNTAYKRYLENQTQKADKWLESANKESQYIIDQVGLLLEDYVRKNLKPDDKRKSISLINGMLCLRAQNPEYIYEEEDTVREFLAKNHKDLLIPQPSKINKTMLKKVGQVEGEKLKINGKEVPGLKVVSRADNFYIK